MRSFLAGLFSLAIIALPSPAQRQRFGDPQSLAPYIPSPQVVVEKMLEAGRVKPGDVVYDLGAGDGRIVITAAQKFGARAVGVELSEELFRSATARIQAMGLENRVRMIHANLLDVDLSEASVVTIYLLTSSNLKLKPNLEKYLKPGARVVSNDFEIRGWNPAQTVNIKADGATHTIYVYDIGPPKK